MASIKDYCKHEILNNEEIKNLFHDYIGNGDYTAREKLIENHLRLVVKISHSYKGKGMDLEDVVSYGNIGLMKAVDKFNPDHDSECSFGVFATNYIKEEIRTAMEKNMTVYHGSFERMKNIEYGEIRLDAPISDDSDKSLYDVFGGNVNPFEVSAEQELVSFIFEEMKNVLTDVEYKILIENFIERKSMEEIGNEIGMTKQNISLKRNAALKKMRNIARMISC